MVVAVLVTVVTLIAVVGGILLIMAVVSMGKSGYTK
jgi:hypothetical protein